MGPAAQLILDGNFVFPMGADPCAARLFLHLQWVLGSESVSFNHDLDPVQFLQSLPHHRIVQFHLAGHSNYSTHLIDTHDNHVIDPVWDLYAETAKRLGPVSTMIERDGNIPGLDSLLAELDHARRIADPYYRAA